MRGPLFELTAWRVREFFREPEAIFWVFVFPVLLALALGLAFRASGPEEVFVGVEEGAEASWMRDALDREKGLSATVLPEGEADDRLSTGKVALVVVPGDPWTYRYDPTRPESRVARLLVDDVLQRAAGRTDARETAETLVTETGARYIDFLVPGLLGMNLMGTGMWGIGFNLVTARSKKLLKRMTATPMRRSDFLVSQILGRMFFLIPEVALLVGFATWIFDVPLRGSLATFAIACVVGAFTFSGLGLLVASRAKTIETVSGLMNFTMLPMWIASGIFFSTSRFPDLLQPLIQALPLTAVIDALRAVMLDGASLLAVGDELAIAAAWGVVSLLVSLRIFRWG
jgi:ABC-type multidrug transport system permease subunit